MRPMDRKTYPSIRQTNERRRQPLRALRKRLRPETHDGGKATAMQGEIEEKEKKLLRIVGILKYCFTFAPAIIK